MHPTAVPQPYAATVRTTPSRKPGRVSYDEAAVHAVLDEALVSHVGFVVDGRPVVLPHLHARVGRVLYLHGSTGARAFLDARLDGLDVCVTTTLLDGLVLARSALSHSMNYRCVVAHGRALVVDDPAEKEVALAALVDAVATDRAASCRPPDGKELAATAVLRLDLAEVSVKTRDAPPNDDPEDLTLPYWAGVLPLRTVADEPVPAPGLRGGVGVPEHVRDWSRPRRPVGGAG